MTDPDEVKKFVDEFLREQIDTVPHLEALLLLWNSRPKAWSVEDMAKALFVPPGAAKEILDDLARQRVITGDPTAAQGYRYESEPGRDDLIAAVDAAYRHELIRISRLIHSKAPSAIREFARAFRLKKDHQ